MIKEIISLRHSHLAFAGDIPFGAVFINWGAGMKP
jgi:hypothetical protein